MASPVRALALPFVLTAASSACTTTTSNPPPPDESTATEGTGTEAGEETMGEETAGEETAGEETAGTATEDTTGEPVGCHELSSNCFENEFSRLTCGGADLCDALEVMDPSLNGGGDEGMAELSFVNPDAATCIMEALRDGTVGQHRISIEPGQQYSRSHRLEVVTGGTVLLYRSVQDDKCVDKYERWEVLRDSTHFEGCLALGTAEAQLDCLLDAGTGECIESDTCP